MINTKATAQLSPEDRKAVQDAVRELLPAGALFAMTRWQLYLLMVSASFVGICLERTIAFLVGLSVLLAVP